jgi:hypothetical protein
MTPKKRSVRKPITRKKQTTPKKVSPKKRSPRDLYFDKEDIRALASGLQRSFYETYSHGYRMEFHRGDTHFPMEPGRKLNPIHARNCMKYLGIDPEIIRSAVSEIEGQEQTPPPKDNHVRMDRWFTTLDGLSPDRIRGLVASTSETEGKWEERLRKCERVWDDVRLPQNTIARLTQRLYLTAMREKVECGTILKQYKKWKGGGFPVPNGGRHLAFFAESGFPQKPGRITIY